MTIVDNTRNNIINVQIDQARLIMENALKSAEGIFGNLEHLTEDAFIRDYIYNQLKDSPSIVDSLEGLGKEARAAFISSTSEVTRVHGRVLLSTFYAYINRLHCTYDQAVKILEGKEDE